MFCLHQLFHDLRMQCLKTELELAQDQAPQYRRGVSPFSCGVIFTCVRVSLALLSLRKTEDYSSSRKKRGEEIRDPTGGLGRGKPFPSPGYR